MARNKLTRKIIEGTTVRVEFADGRSVEVDTDALSPEIQLRARLHGVAQKVGDAYAGAESLDEAFDAAREVASDLLAGHWTTRVGAGAARAVPLLVEALYRVTKSDGRTIDECRELIAEMSDDQKEGLRALAPIAAALDEIRAERLVAKAARSKEKAAGAKLDLTAIGL